MATSASSIDGELKVWHKVTLDFEGPLLSEDPSTFRDYRLDVTFTNKDTGEVVRVPGFFAADGDAANTGATSGNIFRVNFNPPSEGDWEYTASFRTGDDIAASTDPSAGVAVNSIDGATGSLSISPTDKTGDDFRAKGMIVQGEGTNYLQHQGDGDYFIRGGPGIPENFLANPDIDNTSNGRHAFETHAQDANAGDPTWDGGKGSNILGAVNYLAEQGQNTIYVMTMTAGGDGKDVWPWAADDLQNVSQNQNGIDSDTVSTYDISKLSQWEIIFDHMDNQGIYKNVLFQETENDQLLNGGTDAPGTSLSVERLVYMREMIARFGHSNGIQWNLGEENTNTNQERADMARFVKEVDGYDHLVTIHTFTGDYNVYDQLLNVDSFDGPSFQANANNIRSETAEYVEKSNAAGDPWVITWDEDSSGNGIVDPGSNNPDSSNEKLLRESFWGSLTVGGSGGNWYFKGNSGHSLDQNYDAFRGHESVWEWTAAATDFFNTYIPFWEMSEDDGATQNGDDFVMSKPGEYYVVYLKYGNAGDVRLNLSGEAGETFDVYWYDPRNGGPLVEAGQVSGGGVEQLGGPPNSAGKDWVLYVKNSELPLTPSGSAPNPISEPDPTTPDGPDAPQPVDGAVYGDTDGVFVLESEMAPATGGWVAENKIAGFTGENYYRWTGDNRYGEPPTGDLPGTLSFNINVEEAGDYFLAVRSGRTKEGTPGIRDDEANDVLVRIDGGPWVKVFAGGMEWEAINGWATTFDIHDQKSPAQYNLTAGVHTLEISGRSTNTLIDKIILAEGAAVTNNSLPLSPLVDGTPTTPTAPDTPDPDPVVDPVPDTPTPGDPGEPPIGDGPGDLTATVFLMDSTTDQPIAEALGDGAVVDWSQYADKPVNVVVEFSGADAGQVSSAVLTLDGGAHTQTESAVPFALFGDVGSDLSDGQIGLGAHTLSVQAYTGTGGQGALLKSFEFDLVMADGVTTAPDPAPPVVVPEGDIDPPAEYDLEMVLALVNATNDEVVTRIADGAELNSSMLQGGSLNLKANVFGTGMEDVESVRIILDGEDRLEVVRPYALFGDDAGDYIDGALSAGAHTVTIQAFTNESGTGEPLMQRSFDFSADDAMGSGAATPTQDVETPAAFAPTAVLALVDADTDKVLVRIGDGDVIDPALLDGANLALKANVFGAGMDAVNSVRITLDDGIERIEAARPFAVFGDDLGDYLAGALGSGEHNVKIEAFASDDGSGPSLIATEIDFTASGALGDPDQRVETETPPFDDPADLLELFVVDMETGASLGALQPGETWPIDGIADRALRIEARVNPDAANADQVESVALSINGDQYVQNEVGYDFFVEHMQGLGGGKLTPGAYEIAADAYAADNGGGAKLDEEKISITVTEDGLVG
ncbi:MAG: DUF5060 domain-containing protein [Rhodobacteraceae bacterium]|nr:DUF5060 domain-containing protein [Paracoccaceae bacterium]